MGKRVLIVGSGVIGLSTAYYASKKGFEVTIVDRLPEQHDGCSFGNAGMVVPSHFIPLAAPGMVALGLKWMWNPESPFYVKPRLSWELISWGLKFWRAATPEHVKRSAPVIRDMSLASRACFEEFAALTENDFGLVKKGLLMLCKTQHGLDEEAKTAEQANKLGIPAEVLDAKKTAALDPDVRMDIAGSVYFPKDCHLTPQKFMATLKKLLEKNGTKFQWSTDVTGWKVANGKVEGVRTDKGDLTADEYVVCGGSWSPVVARDLGLKIPMQAGKGYSLTLPKPRQLPQICAIFCEARVAVTPMGESLRIGGTMEIAGLNEDINPARIRGIVRSVPQYYPEFKPEDFEGIKPWRGLRPCSPDGMPYIGRTKKYSNLSVATGHSMMGLSLGPISGKVTAEVISNEKPSIDISLLNPDRYG
jgi:D-amino-acid dehydrogenase